MLPSFQGRVKSPGSSTEFVPNDDHARFRAVSDHLVLLLVHPNIENSLIFQIRAESPGSLTDISLFGLLIGFQSRVKSSGSLT